MDRALQLPAIPTALLHSYGVSLLTAGKRDQALAVFQLNQRTHPTEPFWIYLGHARGYTATGDKANAIKNWETAIRNAPDSQKANKPVFERALKALSTPLVPSLDAAPSEPGSAT